jgi:hypothetical protein
MGKPPDWDPGVFPMLVIWRPNRPFFLGGAPPTDRTAPQNNCGAKKVNAPLTPPSVTKTSPALGLIAIPDGATI